jgi:7-carboxy-7-deazaguanine synthase
LKASGKPLSLKISEIFLSLQGETSRVGLPTVFVRLTGCPLRCVWCDTAYAFAGGRTMTLPDILAEVARHDVRHVCVTGGEPLAQPACLALLSELCDTAYAVSLETSGALDIGGVDQRVARIVDLKAPGSGESDRNLWANLSLLTSGDEIKFVLAHRADYEWARQVIVERLFGRRLSAALLPGRGGTCGVDTGGMDSCRSPARALSVAAAQGALG